MHCIFTRQCHNRPQTEDCLLFTWFSIQSGRPLMNNLASDHGSLITHRYYRNNVLQTWQQCLVNIFPISTSTSISIAAEFILDQIFIKFAFSTPWLVSLISIIIIVNQIYIRDYTNFDNKDLNCYRGIVDDDELDYV